MNRKMIVNNLIVLAVIVAIAIAIKWVLNSNKEKNEKMTAIVAQTENSVPVRGELVSRQATKEDLAINGVFAPARQLNFSAENAGRVLQVLVDEGSRVSKGQIIAIIKGEQLNVDKESAQEAYQSALRDQQRYENAFKTGGVTQQQLDQARLVAANAAARVKEAAIKVNETRVKATIDGIVNKRMIEPGSVVSPGTELFELVDISRLKLLATVTEPQISRFGNGDPAVLKISALPGKAYPGKVTFIAPKADNTLNFPVEIELAGNPDHLVKAGMYGTATFSFSAAGSAILIPRSSFVGSVSSNEVFVIKSDSTVSLQKVVAGRIIGDKVEIVSGLKEGQTVVTSGQINLDEGSKVNLVQ